ncbi:MAG: putative carbohydrate transporter, periplasmic binding protein [Thermomicrobiales bacterium]|nr:putative carbohydrate transporter, periplasmic binding protein [Thermomicrobiales bacterium]
MISEVKDMARQGRTLVRRDFLKGASGGVAALLATRSAAAQTPEAAPASSSSGKTIRVLVVGDPFQFALDKIKNDFTAQTGINVEMENLAYDQLNARLATSFVSGTPDADVVTVDQMWTGQYSDSGWIIPLDDYISRDADTNIQDFIPEVLYSLNTWRGRMVTLPIAAYGQGVVYRQDVFEANSIEAPPTDAADAAGWTWDRYREIAESLQGTDFEGTNLFGTVVCGAQPVPIVHMYTQLAASFGTRWFKSFPTPPWDFTPTINSPENVEALAFYKSLYDLSPPEAINYVWFDAGTRFSQGDIGMFYWWTPYFYLTKSDGYMTGTPSVVQDTLGYGVLPKVSDDAEQTVSLGGWSLGIPSSAANQEEAWQFVKWATGADAQKQMALVPDFNYSFSDFARTSLYSDPELQEIYPYLDLQLKIMQQGNGKAVRPPAPGYTTLEGVYGLQLNQALTGALTPEDALTATETLWQNILAGLLLVPYSGESYDDTLENTQALIDRLAGS